MAAATDRLSHEDKEGKVVIRARGKLDAAIGEELVKIGEGARAGLVVDLAQVVYISSSGVAALVRLTTKGDLRIAAIPEHVRGVLELAGVERFFRFFDDEAAALAARAPDERASGSERG